MLFAIGGSRLDGGRLFDGREEATHPATSPAQAVHLFRNRCAAVLQQPMAVLVDRPQRLMHLNEFTAGQPTDYAGLDAVLQHLTVMTLQTRQSR